MSCIISGQGFIMSTGESNLPSYVNTYNSVYILVLFTQSFVYTGDIADKRVNVGATKGR